MTTRILLFAKSPVAGRVKTRLARSLGDAGAVFWYKRMVRRMLSRCLCMSDQAEVEIWTSPHRDPWLQGLASRHGLRLRVQPPGDLGRKMAVAVNRSLAEASRVMIVGADCLGVTPADLRAADEALRAHALAIIPAEDGGYVLIGATRSIRPLVRGVAWGTPGVLQQTLRAATGAGVPCHLLPPRWDVDDAADLKRFRRDLDNR